MTTSAHWLLLGGPEHGKAIHSADRRNFDVFGDDGKMHRYAGHRFVASGVCYQVGIFEAGKTIDTSSEIIERLIREVALEPLADVQHA